MVVDLDDAVDDPVEEGPVVRHDDDGAGEPVHEGLEQVQPVEIEVVGGFVEQEHVHSRQEDGGQRQAGRLTTGQRGGRLVEARRRAGRAGRIPFLGAGGTEADGGEDRRRPGLQIAAAQRDEPVEGVGVGVVGLCFLGQLGRAPVELGRCRRHPRPPGQVVEHGLPGGGVGLLREVADGEQPRRALDATGVGRVGAGQDPQQGGLAGPVGTDDADAVASVHRQRHPVEHDLAPERA